MKTFIYSLINEFLKLRKTPALYLSIVGASLIQGLFFGMRFFKTKHFIPTEGINPWPNFISSSFSASSILLLPLFIILISSLILQTEHKAKAWKQLLVMPVSKDVLFVSKLIATIALLAFTFVLFDLLLIANGLLLGFLKPTLMFLEFPIDFKLLIILSLKLFFVSLSVVGIQYWLSLFFKNFIIPVGIGTALVISGLILMNWDKMIYFPYLFHYLEIAEHMGRVNIAHLGFLSKLEITGLLLSVFAFLGSYIHFKVKTNIN